MGEIAGYGKRYLARVALRWDFWERLYFTAQFGRGGRDRTDDLVYPKHARYQLRYTPKLKPEYSKKVLILQRFLVGDTLGVHGLRHF